MTAARRLTMLASGVLLTLLAGCAAADGQAIAVDRYLDNVTWLADDARQGRDTATPELFETADWVADHFEAAGLQPFGDDDGWMQHFTVSGGRRLIEGNVLEIGGESLSLRRDWIPLQSAMRGEVEAPVVFAGYGISDAENGYDDYADLDVKDKVVLVLRKGPRSSDKESRYHQNSAGGALITFSSKVNTAFRHGAAALIVVNDPAGTSGRRGDRPLRYQGLGPAGSATTASLPAVHVALRSVEAMLGERGLDLAAMQEALDEGTSPKAVPLDGLTAKLVIAAEEPRLDTVNVVGMLPGSDPELADEYVLIGAHMDHLGTASRVSSRAGRDAAGEVHNGADDNASGTAGVVGIANMLAALEDPPRRSVILATWSGEEWGLLGSRYFAENPPVPFEDIVVALNMDMIGRSEEGYVAVEGVGSSPGFTELVKHAAQDLPVPLDLHFAEIPSANSDHASFFEKDMPVINFFTGLHEDYHMPSDDTELINAESGAAIATLAGRILARLANADSRPPFTEPKSPAMAGDHAAPDDPHAAAEDDAPVEAYRVVFGTSPDMAYQGGDGVLLTSVREDTPAQRAGLQGGDKIVAFDGKTVRNLQDYSVLLFSHRPGDTVTVTIQRGDETLELTAVLEGRTGDS
ncbi:MAG: M28 family peptidase [Planctomycetota bacterium]|jgi:hypothetical protein